MKYVVKLNPVAVKYLRKLHPENKKLIRASLLELAKNPYSGKELQEELAGFWSSKPKRFRIIYRISDEEKVIYVFLVGHRKEVYELFAEHLKSKK
jgi:mRNA interferase RelE/StbE